MTDSHYGLEHPWISDIVMPTEYSLLLAMIPMKIFDCVTSGETLRSFEPARFEFHETFGAVTE